MRLLLLLISIIGIESIGLSQTKLNTGNQGRIFVSNFIIKDKVFNSFSVRYKHEVGYSDSDFLHFKLQYLNENFDLVENTYLISLIYFADKLKTQKPVDLFFIKCTDTSSVNLLSIRSVNFKQQTQNKGVIISKQKELELQNTGIITTESKILKYFTSDFNDKLILDLSDVYQDVKLKKEVESLELRSRELKNEILRLRRLIDKLNKEVNLYTKNTSMELFNLSRIIDSVAFSDTVLKRMQLYHTRYAEQESVLKNNLKLSEKDHLQIKLQLDQLYSKIESNKLTLQNRVRLLKGNNLDGGIFQVKKSNSTSIKITYFIYDPQKHTIHINEQSNFQKSIEGCYSKGKNPLFLTNGGMFHSDYSSVGLLILEGKLRYKLNKENPNNGENFFLLPNGVCGVLPSNKGFVTETKNFLKEFGDTTIKYATQSGPMLIYNDTIHHKFVFQSDNEKIRSGVGELNNGKLVFLVSEGNINFYDFSLLFKYGFGCENALFLDGAISDAYINVGKRSGYSKYNYGSVINICKK